MCMWRCLELKKIVKIVFGIKLFVFRSSGIIIHILNHYNRKSLKIKFMKKTRFACIYVFVIHIHAFI